MLKNSVWFDGSKTGPPTGPYNIESAYQFPIPSYNSSRSFFINPYQKLNAYQYFNFLAIITWVTGFSNPDFINKLKFSSVYNSIVHSISSNDQFKYELT